VEWQQLSPWMRAKLGIGQAQPGQPPPPAAGPAYTGLAEVAYQQNELDAALQHVSEGIALCRRFIYTAALATGQVTLAWIRQATGAPAGALAAMSEARKAAPDSGGTWPAARTQSCQGHVHSRTHSASAGVPLTIFLRHPMPPDDGRIHGQTTDK
jgi:hypothetical protein